MNNRKEALVLKVQSAGAPFESDRKELLGLLHSPTMLRTLWAVLKNSDESLAMLSNSDFTTEEGVRNALRLQARARAYSQVVEDLIDFATTETEPEKETTNDGPN